MVICPQRLSVELVDFKQQFVEKNRLLHGQDSVRSNVVVRGATGRGVGRVGGSEKGSRKEREKKGHKLNVLNYIIM